MSPSQIQLLPDLLIFQANSPSTPTGSNCSEVLTGSHKDVSSCRLLRAEVGQEGTVGWQPKGKQRTEFIFGICIKVKHFF